MTQTFSARVKLICLNIRSVCFLFSDAWYNYGNGTAQQAKYYGLWRNYQGQVMILLKIRCYHMFQKLCLFISGFLLSLFVRTLTHSICYLAAWPSPRQFLRHCFCFPGKCFLSFLNFSEGQFHQSTCIPYNDIMIALSKRTKKSSCISLHRTYHAYNAKVLEISIPLLTID